MKLGRIYELTIQTANNQSIVLKYPLTLRFSVNRTTLASANTGIFTLINLSPNHRNQIFKDYADPKDFRSIVLKAGYEREPRVPTIFKGNIQSASSHRRGTDWVTQIEAFDGGDAILKARVATPIPSGYYLHDAINRVIGTMTRYNVSFGKVSKFVTKSSRGITLFGNSWDVVNRLVSPGMAFIDNEKVNVLAFEEYINEAGAFLFLKSETGLLGAHRRFERVLDVEMIFEPRIAVGQTIYMESQQKVYNGQYKVMGVRHSGTISGAVGEEARTTLSLWRGSRPLRAVE